MKKCGKIFDLELYVYFTLTVDLNSKAMDFLNIKETLHETTFKNERLLRHERRLNLTSRNMEIIAESEAFV